MSYSRVTLLPFGYVLSVEQGETILEAALRAGLNLPHSCKGGHFSSCRARIQRGASITRLADHSGCSQWKNERPKCCCAKRTQRVRRS